MKDDHDISVRKRDHIRISLEEDVEFKSKTSWLEHVHLIHSAIPELNYEDINTHTNFLGRGFEAPIIIEGMTGGTEEAAEINANLAEGAEWGRIPMGVGSQRAGVMRPELQYTFRIARERGPHVFLMSNIGAAQLISNGIEFAWKAVKMIEADAVVVHVNPLQELIQPKGETTFRGLLTRLKELTRGIGLPVIVKEVGCGLSYNDALRLKEVGVAAIDVAGSGGTNWTEIERLRALEANAFDKAMLAEVFSDWGIPTAAAVLEVSSIDGIEVVGSGGIRNGLDVAKLITLGAKMGGLARPFLQAAKKGPEEVKALIKAVKEELRAAMFLTGSRSLEELARHKPVILGPLKSWYEQRMLRNTSPKRPSRTTPRLRRRR